MVTRLIGERRFWLMMMKVKGSGNFGRKEAGCFCMAILDMGMMVQRTGGQ